MIFEALAAVTASVVARVPVMMALAVVMETDDLDHLPC
jgi:hypothetical protein